MVVKTKKGHEVTFVINRKTAKRSEFEAGDAVRIRYGAGKGGNRAVKVTMPSTRAEGKKSNSKAWARQKG